MALIIDSSGSMLYNDPLDQRKAAAKYFVDLAQPGDRIAVVDFDDTLNTWAPLRTIQTTADRDALKSAIDLVDSDGNTDLGLGLREGYNQLLSDTTNNKKAAIFLTDGQGPYNNEGALYQNKGWPIYTIALSSSADSNLLRVIATGTGGKPYSAATPDVLQDIYRDLSSRLQGQTLIDRHAFNIFPSQILDFSTPVANPSAQLTFSMSWPGSDVSMRLRTPSGATIDANTVAPGIYHAKGATYEIFRIDSPEAGSWGIQVQGVDVSAAGEPVTLNVSARISRIHLPLAIIKGNSTAPTATPIAPNPTPLGPTATPTNTPTSTATAVPPTNTPTPTNTPVPINGCVASAGAWQNRSIAAQTGTFTAAFDATPSAANMDGVMGFSAGAANEYASLAAIARFSPAGLIDARNGSAYQAVSQIAYVPGVSYHFRLEVNIPNHTYSVFVTPAGGAEQVVGNNFAFRTEQSGVASLANMALYAKSGSHQACNITITLGTQPPPSTCTTSSSSWQNAAISAQGGNFTAAFDATPNSGAMDGVMGLSAGSANDYANLAVIARFSPTGTIDARNGGAYQADTQILYSPGVTYHFRLAIRIPSHTYDVFVTPAGGAEQLVGSNFAFRTEQSGVASLANMAVYAKTGSHTVCNLAISP